MGLCWAVGCNHHNQREKCKFFTLPKDTKTRNRWLKLLNRSDLPGPGCVVCSCHFKNGLRINGPELQEHLKKAFNNDFPPPPQKRRKQITEKVTIPTDIPSYEINAGNALDIDKYISKKLCYLNP
uniref:THAP-type domain-containing protein n=1 Tax=Schizaphis graminum TaxID=13262 RepID=A0A2S2PBS9_SCHGA